MSNARTTLLISLAFIAAACGGRDTPTGQEAPTSPTVAAPEATVDPEPAPGSVPTPPPPVPDVEPEVEPPRAVESPELPPVDEGAELLWTESELSGSGARFVAMDQGFLAYDVLSTSEVLVSSDGITWTSAPLDPGNALSILDTGTIAPLGSGLVAIGRNGASMWRSDDGLSWVSDELDLEFPNLGVFDSADVESVVAGSVGLVLIGRMDRDRPDEHRWFVWTSQDGAEWSLFDQPFAAGSYINSVLPVGGGFVTHGFVDSPGEEGGGRIWTSNDGGTWQAASDEVGSASEGLAHDALAVWGDRIVAVGSTNEGIALWVSSDALTWEELPPSPVLAHTDQFAVRADAVAAGPLGIVVLGELSPPPLSAIAATLEKNGIALTVDFASFVLTVADAGSVLVEATLDEILNGEVDALVLDDLADDAGLLTFIHPGTGTETVFTFEEIEEARLRALRDAGIDPEAEGDETPIPALWFSPDGEHWSLVDIPTTFGRNDLPGLDDVIVGNDAVILRWFDHMEIGEDEEETVDVIWVGTPGR